MTKTIKLFEAFAGVSGQHKAMANIFSNKEFLARYGIDPDNVKYKVVGTSEISKSAIVGYDAIHHGPQSTYAGYDTIKTKTMLNFISKFPLIKDDGKALLHEKIEKWNHEDIRQLYIALKRNKNFGSITDIKGTDLPRIDIFFYSFPCNDLSSIGGGAGLEEGTRSGLLWEIERVLRELAEIGKLPKTLVCENVPELVSKKYIHDWNRFVACLVEFGYFNTSMILDARDFGIPQARKRFFCISELNGNLNYNIDKKDSYSSLQKLLYTGNEDFSDEQKSRIPNRTKSRDKYAKGLPILNNMSHCNTITTKQDRYPNAGLFHCDLDGKLVDNPENDLSANGSKSNFCFITFRQQMQLMGFESEDYDKLKEANLLDSSIEKLAGNSIVVQKLEAIFISIIHRMVGKKRVVRAKVDTTPIEVDTAIDIPEVQDEDVLKINIDLSSILDEDIIEEVVAEETIEEPSEPTPEKETLVVTFSGGRTSGYMCHWLKENMNDIYDFKFIYANTGQEHPKTLEFINKVDKYLGLDLIWVEAIIHDGRVGTTHKIVNYESVDRYGKVFEDVIKKYGLPNQSYLHCTRELKLNPIYHWMKSNGYKGCKRALGIRYDEMRRVRDSPEYIYPLATMSETTKEDVLEFWANQPFDLEVPEHLGNCCWCYKKSDKKLLQVAKDMPEAFTFIKKMEDLYTNVKDRERIVFRHHRTSNNILNNDGFPDGYRMSSLDTCREECGVITLQDLQDKEVA